MTRNVSLLVLAGAALAMTPGRPAVGAALDALGFSTITMTTTSPNPRHRSTTAARKLVLVNVCRNELTPEAPPKAAT